MCECYILIYQQALTYTKIINLLFIAIQKNEVTISSLVKVTMELRGFINPFKIH
ncbi:hypothetical protein DSUL_60186 [Desulfovibrionales bacterium]